MIETTYDQLMFARKMFVENVGEMLEEHLAVNRSFCPLNHIDRSIR